MQQLTLAEITKRKLDTTYVIVYAIKNEVNVKKNDTIEKSDIYSLIGIDIRGIRYLLNIYQDRPSNTRFWLDCFEGLKSRGVKNILFLSVDDNKNMKRTAKIAFPDIIFVDSITDITIKFFQYTTERSNRNVASKISMLYTQKTLTEFKNNFALFKETYNNAIQQRLIGKYLNNIEGLYRYSQNIRKMLYKHSSNIKFYDKIRLAFKENKYVSDVEEIYKYLINEPDNLFGFTSYQKKEWMQTLNDLISIYPKIEFI